MDCQHKKRKYRNQRFRIKKKNYRRNKLHLKKRAWNKQ